MNYPEAIDRLIKQLSELPSVGPKTAERYVFYLLKQRQEKLEELSLTIKELKEKTVVCRKCNCFAESNPCSICKNENRNKELLCLVENTQDLISVESTKQFNGYYFVLGKLINTIKETNLENELIKKLFKQINDNKVKELIIALNFNMEGETTTLYLKHLLKDKVKISRLAKGLPAGSDLEYVDELTLASALKNRNEVK